MEVVDVRCLLLGPTSAGKTTLVSLLRNGYSEEPKATIGVDYHVIPLYTTNKRQVKLRITDTSGTERFKTIIRSYYRNVKLLLLVFDLSEIESFEGMKFWWHDFINEETDCEPTIVIIGTKTDLVKEKRVVERQTVLDYISNQRLNGYDIRGYWEVSAKSPTVGNELKDLLTKVVQELDQEGSLPVSIVSALDTEPLPEGCCTLL